MLIASLFDPFAIHFDTFAGDVYTLDTAGITLTTGNITGDDLDISAGTGNYTSSGTITGGNRIFTGDSNTYIGSDDDDMIQIVAGGVELAEFDATEITFGRQLNLQSFGLITVGAVTAASLTLTGASDLDIGTSAFKGSAFRLRTTGSATTEMSMRSAVGEQSIQFEPGNTGQPAAKIDCTGGAGGGKMFVRNTLRVGTAGTFATTGTLEADGISLFGDGVWTNYTEITATGDIEPKGSAFIVIQKASGNGIKVDQTTPTFGFADLLGEPAIKNTGGSRPALIAYRDGLFQFEFAAGEEEYFDYHIPHDYVKGTDIFLHYHWSTNVAVTGGTVTFDYEISYAKAHAQAPFPASVSGTVVSATASTTQYTQELTEIQISASSPSGSQIDTDDLEPDGVIICTAGLNANNLTGGGVPNPFIHYIDIHYQTTGLIGTKAKAPDFYS